MPKVVFLDPEGQRHVLDVDPGTTLMAAAQQNGVPGILGECGGSCSCATCHVYVDPEFAALFGEVGEFENELLDVTACDRLPTSRLACQLKVTDRVNGVVITIPPSQV